MTNAAMLINVNSLRRGPLRSSIDLLIIVVDLLLLIELIGGPLRWSLAAACLQQDSRRRLAGG